jgi:excisionase family DNA binding protein
MTVAKMLTVKEAAELTGVHESMVYSWTSGTKRLRHLRLGRNKSSGSIRIALADLEAFLAAQTVEPEVAPKPTPAPGGAFRHIDPTRAGRNRRLISSPSDAAC